MQQQETTYAWHKLEQTERVAQEEIAATQLAASRVMQSTMDSATAALQHSRLRINETQHSAAMAVGLSEAAAAEALELARRLAFFEMPEQRVGFAEKAELALTAISKGAGEQEYQAIKMVEACADEAHRVSVRCNAFA